MDNFRDAAGQPRQRPTIDGFAQNRNEFKSSRHAYLDRPRVRPVSAVTRANYLPQPAQQMAPAPELTASRAAAPQPQPAQTIPNRNAARSLPAINMSLPGAEELIKHQPVVKRRKFYRTRTWMFRGVVTALVLIIGVGGLLFAQGYMKVHKVFKGGATAAALQKDVNPNKLKGEGDGRINILLMGMGGAGHDAPDLTDTMMIASIDPINKNASLVSIPRDMWVMMPSGSKMKLNAAYETGKYKYLGKIDNSNTNSNAVKAGFTTADQTIEDITGIAIHYNVLVDFQAFRKAIDTVGGVDVNVPEQLYDPTMAWENNRNPVLAKAGLQHFDGVHALIYVRSRETSSDFARSERQRATLLSLKDKVTTLGTLSNPLKISQLMSAFGNNVHTDLSLADTTSLYRIFKDINNTKVASVGLADAPNNYITTDNVNGQSVVRPKAGFFDYTAIRSYLRGALPDGYIKKENSNITILNGTARVGLASEKSDALKSFGYNVGTVANAPTQTYDTTVIVDRTGGKDKYTCHYLEQRFGVKATTKLPDSSILPGSADFIIILGNDEAFSSQN
jgi:LCP family protein required for cell wall assembly